MRVVLLFALACDPAPESAPDSATSSADTAVPPSDADGDGVADADDCAPTDPEVFPGATERANGVDDDCDGAVDVPVALSTASLNLRGLTAGDAFGAGVVHVGGRVWVGVPGADLGGGDEGRLLAFDVGLSGTRDAEEPLADVRGDTPGGGLGVGLLAADLDADGVAEVCVGAPGVIEVGCFATGFDGAASPNAALSRFQGPEGTDGFGVVLAAGDFDGDGAADLAIGAPAAAGAGGANDAGAGRVFLAERVLDHTRTDLDDGSSGPFRDAAAGTDLAAVDLDGDGVPALAVGVPIADFPGRVYLLDGAPPANLGDAPLWYEGSEVGDRSGAALTGGDVDGDGYEDVVIAAPARVRVGLVYGSPSAEGQTGASLDATFEDVDSVGFGAAVALVDPDADGAPEVAVTGEGRVSVFSGPYFGRIDTPSLVVTATSPAVFGVADDADLWVADPTDAGSVWRFPAWGPSP